MTEMIFEPARQIPVVAEADLCVVGGSCTGVFAAVRAARLGLKVVLVEKQNKLGGVAVSGLVNIWHCLVDMDFKDRIIAGLTLETIEKLYSKGVLTIQDNRNATYNFNPNELTILLDKYIKENNINLMLHTSYCSVVSEGDDVKAIIVENKDGRQAIKAKFFIDASGDGDVARDLSIPSFVNDYLQPPSACFHLQGEMDGVDLKELVLSHGKEFGLDDDWGWSTHVADCKGLTMRADNHVFGVRCNIASDLTKAEMEGRRQADAFVSMVRKYGRKDTSYALTNLCSYIGIRETVHYKTKFQANEKPLLLGERYSAPIMNGTYPIDIHHANDMGITFRHLDGLEVTEYGKGTKVVQSNWRENMGLTGDYAKYYQIPFDILVGERYHNFIAAGRMLNADMSAFGALRVMVNLNQIGEAAGVAAYLAVDRSQTVQEIDGTAVTELLRKGGSAL